MTSDLTCSLKYLRSSEEATCLRMAQSIPEIYPKLREALELFLHDHRVGSKFELCFRTVTEMDLAEEDILSMEDFAVAFAQSFSFIREHKKHYGCPGWPHGAKQVAEDLLCLLKPVEEELLPPEGPTDQRIWEIFAAAKMQHRQFIIVAAYAGFRGSFPETNELVQSMQAKFKDLFSSFEQVQLQMERQGLVSQELRAKMVVFAKRLKSYCRGSVTSMMTQQEKPASTLHFFGRRAFNLSSEG